MPTFQTSSSQMDLVSRQQVKKVKKIAKGLIKAQRADKENYSPDTMI